MLIATSNFLIPNSTLIVELIAFIIVLAVIRKYVLPRLAEALDTRAAQIKGQLEAADEAKADASKADEDRRAALEEARQQAREIVAQANRTAEQVKMDSQQNAQGEYDRILANAEVEVGLARQRAVEEAATRMGEIVMDVVERVIGREVNFEAHHDLIEEAVAALRADTTGGAAANAGATVNPMLQGYSAAVIGFADASALGTISADLEAIERLVMSNAPLRAALTDTAVTGHARRAVMLDLLQGKVSGEARRLAAYGAMIVHAPDVPSALAWLGTRVRHAAEGRPLEEPPLSLIRARERVSGFATMVDEDMSESELESLEDDLFRFSRIVSATPALRSALVDRDVPVEARQGLVSGLLEGKVAATTVALAQYAVAGGRARDFVGTLDFLVDFTAKARGWRIAHIRAAAEIDDTQRAALSDSMHALVGAPVELHVVVDESLLSGARIRIGDLQVDATARGRIDALREHLMPGGWEPSGFGRGPKTTGQTEGAN